MANNKVKLTPEQKRAARQQLKQAKIDARKAKMEERRLKRLSRKEVAMNSMGTTPAARKDLLTPEAQERVKNIRAHTENAVIAFFSRFHTWEDNAFMDDVRQATLRGAHPATYLLFWCLATFFFLFIVYASWARLDEVTSGQGQVIPSSKIQIIQNLEGGIIENIFVKQGDIVDVNQNLVRLDKTGFESSFSERQSRGYQLRADVLRLQSLIEGTGMSVPNSLRTEAPEAVRQAIALYESSKEEAQSARNTIRQQVEQRAQELADAKSKLKQNELSSQLAQEEYDLAVPLEARGVISRVELLRLQRELIDAKGNYDTAKTAVPSAEAALAEVRSRLNETRLKYINQWKQELAEKQGELNRITELLKADKDRVLRTNVTSPVRGQIKQVLVNTIGQVVQPGQELVEIIPLDDTLLIEAQIRPRDIAFLRPGQRALVKITAYDYSIYGGLEAKLESISPDTIVDERGDAYYKILVRTEKNYLGDEKKPMPIIAGMVASVDIITGNKSLLDYLLKPINKAREKALRER